MPAATDHGRLITQAARQVLAPLGCRQRGRSRLWYDDHGWRLTFVEFQPSGWDKGSYLNVGAMWLWNAKDYWSFDDGYRVGDFQAFEDEAQFADATLALATRAAEEVLVLRRRFDSIGAAAAHLAKKDRPSTWDHFHCAVASAVAGDPARARTAIDAVLAETHEAPWVAHVKALATRLAADLGSTDAVRELVRGEIVQARALLKLAPLAPDARLWD